MSMTLPSFHGCIENCSCRPPRSAGFHFAMVQKLGSSQLHQQFSLSLLSEKHEELIGKPSSESDIYKLRARLATSIELSFTVSKCSASQKSKACLGPPGAYLGSGNNFI